MNAKERHMTATSWPRVSMNEDLIRASVREDTSKMALVVIMLVPAL